MHHESTSRDKWRFLASRKVLSNSPGGHNRIRKEEMVRQWLENGADTEGVNWGGVKREMRHNQRRHWLIFLWAPIEAFHIWAQEPQHSHELFEQDKINWITTKPKKHTPFIQLVHLSDEKCVLFTPKWQTLPSNTVFYRIRSRNERNSEMVLRHK